VTGERPALEAALHARLDGPPFVLAGPPGSGKTTLLLALRERILRAGGRPVYLDLMGAASTPDRFARAALAALPAERFAEALPEALALQRLLESGRARMADAVRAVFALWAGLGRSGAPATLLLDAATEVRSLAYFAGLREVATALGTALGSRPRGVLLATSFPTQARGLWPDLDVAEVPPLAEDEAGGPAAERAALLRATGGWARYVSLLRAERPAHATLEAAWAAAMAPGGALDRAARATHEMLLLRSRGYGVSKAVLALVAEEEGMTLTRVVARLGRTPGATRDYLQWLVGVDALAKRGKRYFYVDVLLRDWVRLHARGLPPTLTELAAAARAAVAPPTERGAEAPAAPPLSGAEAATRPAPAPPESPGPPALVSPVALRRPDTLMEID
jgi:hypothetical protein